MDKFDLFYRNIHKERPDSVHYSIFQVNEGAAMQALREMFPDGEADEMNFVLFSTSGVHGSYCTIEDVEESPDKLDWVTFLIVQPRLVTLRYGNVCPSSPEDFEFLKKLRASSKRVVYETIGSADND